jgi:hypothetical protein
LVSGQTRGRLAQVNERGLPTPWNAADLENIAAAKFSPWLRLVLHAVAELIRAAANEQPIGEEVL